MKEKKYRAWDGKTMWSAFTLIEGLNDKCMPFLGPYPKDTVFVEFTGLTDKEGVEIYEGDLLEHTYDKRLLIWEVEFRNGVFGVICINGDHRSSFYPCDGSNSFFTDRVIIGNIYESTNPL